MHRELVEENFPEIEDSKRDGFDYDGDPAIKIYDTKSIYEETKGVDEARKRSFSENKAHTPQ